MKITELKPLEQNPFRSGDGTIERIAKSIEDFQKMMEIRKIIIDENKEIIGGNKRYFALKDLGYKEIPDSWIEQRTDLTSEEKKRFIVTDNAHFGSDWDFEMLQDWDIPDQDWGVEMSDFSGDSDKDDKSDDIKNSFIIEVICNDENDQENKYNELIEKGYECRILTL